MFAEAAVGADAEGGMHHLFAMDVKGPWVRAHLGITRGRRKIERHSVACLDRHTAHFHVGTRGAPDSHHGRVETDRFLHCRSETPRIPTDFLTDVRLGCEFIQGTGNGMSGGSKTTKHDIQGGVDFVLPGTGSALMLDAGEEDIHQVMPCGFFAAGGEELLQVRMHTAEGCCPLSDWPKRIQIDVVKERSR